MKNCLLFLQKNTRQSILMPNLSLIVLVIQFISLFCRPIRHISGNKLDFVVFIIKFIFFLIVTILFKRRVMFEEKPNEKRFVLPRMTLIDTISFEIVLKYIYTGRIREINLTVKILSDIIKVSKKLDLVYLSRELPHFLSSETMIIENAVFIYQAGCQCNDTGIMDKCGTIIYNMTEDLIVSKSLSNLSKRCLGQLIESKNENISEFYILKIVHKWHTLKNLTSIEQTMVNKIQFENFSSDQKENALNSEYSEIIDMLTKAKLNETLRSENLNDYDKLFSATADHTIKIWNLESGECVRTIEDDILKSAGKDFSHHLIENQKYVTQSNEITIRISNYDSGETFKV